MSREPASHQEQARTERLLSSAACDAQQRLAQPEPDSAVRVER